MLKKKNQITFQLKYELKKSCYYITDQMHFLKRM